MIAPVVVRNAIAFHAFVPTGLGAGTNMWEGIGETERGAKEFGAAGNDREVIEREREALAVPSSAPFDLYYPDGIRRDRERTRKSIAIIEQHPFWYAGTVVNRMIAVMKYAGEPNGIYGSSGINVTAKKCLPPRWQGGAVALGVTILGMAQSVLRYILLPLMCAGVIVAFRSDWCTTGLLSATVFYYLGVGSLIHTHIRYGLPMHALLTIFAGLALWRLKDFAISRKLSSLTDVRKPGRERGPG